MTDPGERSLPTPIGSDSVRAVGSELLQLGRSDPVTGGRYNLAHHDRHEAQLGFLDRTTHSGHAGNGDKQQSRKKPNLHARLRSIVPSKRLVLRHPNSGQRLSCEPIRSPEMRKIPAH